MRRRLVLWVAVLASFVSFLDGSIVNVALPAIAEDLGRLDGDPAVGDRRLPAHPRLASSSSPDRCRTRSAASGSSDSGLVIFGIASVACALAPTAIVLIGARAVQGVGAALLVPSSLALITATFDGPARAKAIGTWTAWTGVAFVVGPPLGGLLVDTVGWRSIFVLNVLPIALTLVLLVRLARLGIPEHAARRGAHRRPRSRARLASGSRARCSHSSSTVASAGTTRSC